mmetsp:Transcript_53019/g.72583  ORF Transcript_53019/g.72583 Transcript_53019/m.72583 type:complete len:104 (+) Transcript_53019:193-504(+)
MLDELEKCQEKCYVVTISTSTKIFHSGFNIGFWSEDMYNVYNSILTFDRICARLLALPMPTLCCMTGHSYAGGLFFSWCNDKRIMRDNYGFACVSELNLGISI